IQISPPFRANTGRQREILTVSALLRQLFSVPSGRTGPPKRQMARPARCRRLLNQAAHMDRSRVTRLKCRLIAGAGVASILLVASGAIAAPQLVLVNAKVFTADPARPYAQAVAIEDGRIYAVD